MAYKYGTAVTLKFPAKDSDTGAQLYPGDRVMFYPAYYFWKVDEETGKKRFLNRYELIKRGSKSKRISKTRV